MWYDRIDVSNFIFVTTTLYKIRSVELYALACNILPNVKGLDWRIALTADDLSFDKLNITTIYEYNRIIHLAQQTGNTVTFYPLGDVPVAHAKANIFKLVANSNKWLMNVDDDVIFDVERLKNLVSTLYIYGDKACMYIYPMVDLYNGRNHGDYVGTPVSCREARHLADEYGDGILGHLKLMETNMSTLSTNIGSGGFIIHSSSITNDRLEQLYMFSVKERGHDIVFGEQYSVKRVLVNTWVFHMRVDEAFYNEHWKGYNALAHKIYNQI